ncbi:hypothetical protein KCP70_20100 [Salmonella enterica subsp. enterica]|nr:hypothetical protein KCP70_20100 [Salmonella enterica subsp. enterica]
MAFEPILPQAEAAQPCALESFAPGVYATVEVAAQSFRGVKVSILAAISASLLRLSGGLQVITGSGCRLAGAGTLGHRAAGGNISLEGDCH